MLNPCPITYLTITYLSCFFNLNDNRFNFNYDTELKSVFSTSIKNLLINPTQQLIFFIFFSGYGANTTSRWQFRNEFNVTNELVANKMQVIEKVPIVFIVKWKGISKELKFKTPLKKPTLKISWKEDKGMRVA